MTYHATKIDIMKIFILSRIVFAIIGLSLILAACGIPPRQQTQPAAAPAVNAQPIAAASPMVSPKQSAPSNGRYDIGSPILRDVWVDGVGGNDSNDGSARNRAFRSLRTAWNSLPSGTLINTGYRIRLTPGQYAGAYLEDKRGTAQFPILIEPADGPGTVTFRPSGGGSGQPQFLNVSYVYLQDLNIDVSSTGGDAFQCERCDHLLLRRMNIKSRRDGGQTETIKVNQSQYVYIEDSDISGAGDNAFDAVAVQYGHLIGNRCSQANDWCAYLKGGSAYFRVEGNEFANCGTGGFTAGQGAGVQFMVSPWLHYEAYGVQFVNNVIHEVEGACFGANGAYNVLFAFNTCYRTGQRSHIFEAVFGGHGCDGGEIERCRPLHAAGAWTVLGDEQSFIPNRNLFVYNNIFYNPTGMQSQWQHLTVQPAITPPTNSNVASPARADDTLRIRGNIIWNGPTTHPLGVEGDTQGCAASNPTCNAAQLRADNRINSLEPQLTNPSAGDFRPLSGGNLLGIAAIAIPDFSWADAPTRPAVPAGPTNNAVLLDRAGVSRTATAAIGAYAGGAAGVGAPPVAQTTVTPATTATSAAAQSTTTSRPSQTPTVLLPALVKGGSTSVAATPTRPPAATATPRASTTVGPLTVVALGDSLTEGERDDSAQGGGFPRRLLPRLQTLRSGSTMLNLGKSGWNSDALINGDQGLPSQLTQAEAALNNARSQGRQGVALVWIGSNDLWYLYEYNNPAPADDVRDAAHFASNIDTIVRRLRATGAIVVLALLDDQSKRPVAADVTRRNAVFTGISAAEVLRMSAQVGRYNSAIAQTAAQQEAAIADFFATTIFTAPATLADDGNHPNAVGYDQISEIWFNAIQARLTR